MRKNWSLAWALWIINRKSKANQLIGGCGDAWQHTNFSSIWPFVESVLLKHFYGSNRYVFLYFSPQNGLILQGCLSWHFLRNTKFLIRGCGINFFQRYLIPNKYLNFQLTIRFHEVRSAHKPASIKSKRHFVIAPIMRINTPKYEFNSTLLRFNQFVIPQLVHTLYTAYQSQHTAWGCNVIHSSTNIFSLSYKYTPGTLC